MSASRWVRNLTCWPPALGLLLPFVIRVLSIYRVRMDRLGLRHLGI